MDPIDDLRQRVFSAAGRDAPPTIVRTSVQDGRRIIQPTSMSRVVWRVSMTDDPSMPATPNRLPRPD